MTKVRANLIAVAIFLLIAATALWSVTMVDSRASMVLGFGVVCPLQVILVLGFSIHAIKSPHGPKSRGWLWVLSFFLCSWIFLPVYWFKFLRPKAMPV